MVEENRNEGAKDSINMLLEQSRTIEGRNDGKFFPHPSTPIDNN